MSNISSIILKDIGGAVGFVDFEKNYIMEDYYVKIVSKKTMDVIQKFSKKENAKFKIYNIELGDFVIEYYKDDEFKVMVHSQDVPLVNYILSGSDAMESVSFKEKIYSVVKIGLDDMGKNQAEKEEYLKRIKSVTSDINSRNFMINKISEILLQSNLLKKEDINDAAYEIYSRFYGMGILQELDDDPEMGEIMVNARVFPEFMCKIYYVKNQIKYEYSETFKNKTEMEMVFNRAIEFSGLQLNAVDSSEIEAERINRDRVTIAVPDASENWTMNIRKFSNFTPSKEGMLESGTITKDMIPLLEAIVKGKSNIGIGGAMGTGKTTIIQYLLSLTHPIERKTVIASVSEMAIDGLLKEHDIIILKVDEKKDLTFSKQISTALRTTAERIIIPESRSDEMKSIYDASLKIKGNMFTSHANDDDEFLTSIANSYLASEKNVQYTFKEALFKMARNVNIVIIMRKVGSTIRIKSISEVLVNNEAYLGMNKLIEWQYSKENPLEGKYVMENKISERLKGLLNENGVPINLLEKL